MLGMEIRQEHQVIHRMQRWQVLEQGTVYEDGTLTATGQLTVTDSDAGEDQFIAASNVLGNYGNLTIASASLPR